VLCQRSREVGLVLQSKQKRRPTSEGKRDWIKGMVKCCLTHYEQIFCFTDSNVVSVDNVTSRLGRFQEQWKKW